MEKFTNKKEKSINDIPLLFVHCTLTHTEHILPPNTNKKSHLVMKEG